MKPKATIDDCRALWHALNDGKWHKAREIETLDDRTIRAVCAEKPDHFLSTQLGYKLVDAATTAEIETAIADLRSRIKHLDNRASALEHRLTLRNPTRRIVR